MMARDWRSIKGAPLHRGESAGAEGVTALFYLRHLPIADTPTPRLRYRLLSPPGSAPTR